MNPESLFFPLPIIPHTGLLEEEAKPGTADQNTEMLKSKGEQKERKKEKKRQRRREIYEDLKMGGSSEPPKRVCCSLFIRTPFPKVPTLLQMRAI